MVVAGALLLPAGCLAPDATPRERAEYAGRMEAVATATEMTGASAALLTGGISVPVAAGLAALFRALGKRAGVRAVAQPIEEARDRVKERELGNTYIVVKRDAVTIEHRRRKVSKAIKRATTGK